MNKSGFVGLCHPRVTARRAGKENRRGASCAAARTTRARAIRTQMSKLPIDSKNAEKEVILEVRAQEVTSEQIHVPEETVMASVRPGGMAERLENWEERILEVKCPFWKRRFMDTLEAVQSVLVWISARHKRLQWFDADYLSPVSSARMAGKQTHLPLDVLLDIIREDFDKRQYYVSGQLTKSIYSEDCVFDGPDPDVPVRGLKKYVSATSNLFDRRRSRIDLLHAEVVDESRIRAFWRLEGVLRLPWRPSIKPYLGSTTYTMNEFGLISEHFETWSISALDAFASTLVSPRIGAKPAESLEVIRARMLEGGNQVLHEMTGLE